jgi:hypothetical protein
LRNSECELELPTNSLGSLCHEPYVRFDHEADEDHLHGHKQRDDSGKQADDEQDTSTQLQERHDPSRDFRQGHIQLRQKAGNVCRPTLQLGPTVSDEDDPHPQAKDQPGKPRHRMKGRERENSHFAHLSGVFLHEKAYSPPQPTRAGFKC